jgi:carboxymethylenebutenolidase
MGGEEIDPTQAASEKLNRRAFVGVSAATAAVAGATPAALAAQPTLGEPHAPLVPEGSPEMVAAHVQLQRPDIALPAYTAEPSGPQPSSGRPSVVVIMHVWGVDTSIRDVVRRLASAGFPAIAPDLYGRFGAPSGDGATDYTIFRPYAQRLDRTQYAGDIRAAATWLKNRYLQKVGIIGFCMGGRITLLQTIDNADVFSAACPFYGPLTDVDPARVGVPVCGSYGARDKGIPAADVRAFWSALKVPNDLKIYDNAGHAFFDDQRPSYVASAAEDAWTRVLAFLHKYLAPPKT